MTKNGVIVPKNRVIFTKKSEFNLFLAIFGESNPNLGESNPNLGESNPNLVEFNQIRGN